MEEKKKVLKKVIIASIGAVAAILTLLLLYGLATGRVQETIVKYEALNYMENKYKEKFEIKKYGKYDKIFKTSWGYELWMVPKNKPDKDYIYDMEEYVFKKNGKFHENYKIAKKDYNSWLNYKRNLEIYFENEKYYYDIWALNDENITVTLNGNIYENKEPLEIAVNLYLYKEKIKMNDMENIKEKLFSFIKKHKENKMIFNMYINVYIYDGKKEFLKENLQGILIRKDLSYLISIERDEYKKITKTKDIEKYIIDNRKN